MQITTDGRFIITGAGGGIAESIVATFAAAGARLALVDIGLDRLRDRALQHNALAFEADLTDPATVGAVVSAAVEQLGGLDGVIHTTGGFAMAPADEPDLALYQRMFDLNVRTLVVTAQAVLPLFRKQGHGFLAAFSAAPGWHRSGGAGMSLYAAAKAAVASYLHAVQDELGQDGVTTAVVYPMGVVDTPGNRHHMPAADRAGWIDPQEIAQSLLFAATRGRRGRLTDLPVFPTD